MAKSGENWKKLEKVVKSGKKWKNGEKWLKVAKSGENICRYMTIWISQIVSRQKMAIVGHTRYVCDDSVALMPLI